MAGWWRGWELCSELGSFGSTDVSKRLKYYGRDVTVMHISAGRDTMYSIMNTKKIVGAIIVALLVIALSVGMAAAKPATVTIDADPITNPLDGTTITTTLVTVSDIDYKGMGTPHTRCVSIITDHKKLEAKITDSGTLDTGWAKLGNRKEATYTASGGDYVFTLHVRGTAPSHQHITVADNNGTTYTPDSAQDSASCTRPVDIPEFAAIAIPVIALLGLVLYMRKKKD